MKHLELEALSGTYNKAAVLTHENGDRTLYSYYTAIITRTTDGGLIRHYDDWTLTTGRHIKQFCGLNKKEFLKLPLDTKSN